MTYINIDDDDVVGDDDAVPPPPSPSPPPVFSDVRRLPWPINNIHFEQLPLV